MGANDSFSEILGDTSSRALVASQKERRFKKECLNSEPKIFVDLFRDISAELDITTLCHRILVKVVQLTQADRASLFLTEGAGKNNILVAKLLDITVNSDLEKSLQLAAETPIRLPLDTGIVGYAAKTKEIVNIKDAYKDPRFDPSVDQTTGYITTNMLCVPICEQNNDVIGVAEIINKNNGTEEFSCKDIEIIQRYFALCGFGKQNERSIEEVTTSWEYKRNQMLLKLAKGIFEEQTSLDRLVTKIMSDSTEIFKCERCKVYLLDSNKLLELDSEKAQNLPNMKFQKGTSLDMMRRMHQRLSSTSSDDGDTKNGENKIGDNKNGDNKIGGSFDLKKTFTCDRLSKNWTFPSAFELRLTQGVSRIIRYNSNQLVGSPHTALAVYVCDTKKPLHISDVQDCLVCPSEDAENLTTQNILTIPIFNSKKKILGVAQMINKEDGSDFTDYDINTFEAFATFFGLGIQNTQVYENACELMARQQVALECLSYHATASKEDTDALKNAEIPTAQEFNLYNYDFDDFNLSDEDTCKCVLQMFIELKLIQKFSISYEVMCRWILSVKKNYRAVKYHNWRHALLVAQTMFAILKTGKIEKFFNDLEMLGLLVACLSHDLDHRGTNNSFQTKTDSPLAILYSTSTMEHHHFDQCVMILSQDTNNIFQTLSSDDYRAVMKLVESAILSTDMGLYFKKKNTFLELSDNGEFDWQSPEKKQLLCGMMMTACDVSAIAKPWNTQHKIAKLVADEFFEQGDLEKLKLNMEPIAMMDREKRDELPKMQVGFIDHICLPLYKALSESFPWVKPLYDGCARNKEQWQILSEQVDMGLTWIDHEYIEKPVERNENEVVSLITLHSKNLERSTASSVQHSEIKSRMRQSIRKKFSRKSLKIYSSEERQYSSQELESSSSQSASNYLPKKHEIENKVEKKVFSSIEEKKAGIEKKIESKNKIAQTTIKVEEKTIEMENNVEVKSIEVEKNNVEDEEKLTKKFDKNKNKFFTQSRKISPNVKSKKCVVS